MPNSLSIAFEGHFARAISRPFRANRFIGCFPGLKPWAKFFGPSGAIKHPPCVPIGSDTRRETESGDFRRLPRILLLFRTPHLPEFLPLRQFRWQIRFLENTPATPATNANQLMVTIEFGEADFAVAILTVNSERLMASETTNFEFAHSFAHA